MSEKRQTRKVGVAGGFMNQMMGNNRSEPKVGEGATILHYSDRDAFEVISVSEDKNSCVIRKMDTKNIGECYGDETYEYSSNPDQYTYNLEWHPKKMCWGKVSFDVEIIKALRNKLIKQYGWGWSDFLPVKLDTLQDGENLGIHTKMKLVEGVTKTYKNFDKVSVSFGRMDQFRDPSF